MSLTTAPSKPQLRSRGSAARFGQLTRRLLGADLGLGLVLGGALAALVFVTTGGTTNGTNLAPNTWAQIVLVLVAAGLGTAAVRWCRTARAWGAVSLALFAALAALNLLSISWSVQPANSWLDTNLTLSYLAAFAGGVALARLAPERWAAIVGAVVVLTVVVSGYSLLAKVFPAAIDPTGPTLFGARLTAPFGYGNAVGLMAALGLPACVWLGAGRGARPLARALSVPAMGILVAALLLSYSRGSLVAAAIGLACWFVLVPLRLRGTLVLALGAVAGGTMMLWALGSPAITGTGQALPARIAAGHTFGLVLVAMLLVSLAVGLAAARAADRTQVRERDRRRIGKALLAVVACVPVVVVIGLSMSSRGLTGEISHVWSQVTGASVGGVAPTQVAGRLLDPGNLHAAYWTEGIKVGEHAVLKGVGAGGFGTASPRYSTSLDVAAHAHSYVIETFADFGLIGLAVTLSLLVAWSVAAARATDLRPPSLSRMRTRRGPGTGAAVPERAAERAGLLTLLAVVVIFGAHSLIDWTWFIPGVAVPALVCAGWLAGRGPLADPVGRAPRRGRARRDPLGESSPARQTRGPLRHVPRPRAAITAGYRAFFTAPGKVAAIAATAAIALLCAWTIWQPLRSSDADAAALVSLSANHPAAALADVRSAAAINPFSTEPLLYEWTIYSSLGDASAARAALKAGVSLQPANSDTWYQLGQYDLVVGRTRDAITELREAVRLFPHNVIAASLLGKAQSHK